MAARRGGTDRAGSRWPRASRPGRALGLGRARGLGGGRARPGRARDGARCGRSSLERDLGRAGAAPVAAALSLAVWAPPLAAAYLLGLHAAVRDRGGAGCDRASSCVAVRRPSALPARGRARGRGRRARRRRVRLSRLADLDARRRRRLFHVGLMRRLGEAPSLSFANVSPFLHGPANAGYAFPILHAAFEGVARLAGHRPGRSRSATSCPVCAALAIAARLRARPGAHRAGGRSGYLAAAMIAWDLCSLINGLVIQINQPPPFSALGADARRCCSSSWLEIRHVAPGGARRPSRASASSRSCIPTYAIPVPRDRGRACWPAPGWPGCPTCARRSARWPG